MTPLDYGDPDAEYRALRTGVALRERDDRALVVAHGADRQSFLQGMLTNEVAALAPGAGCPALLLTIQGRPVTDVVVAVTDDAVVLDVEASRRAASVEALDHLLIADDVTLDDPVPPVRLIGLDGPEAAALVGPTASALAPWAHAAITLAGVACRVQRTPRGADDGFMVHVPAASHAAVWAALIETGARPCGRAASEGRRIECGAARIGVDTDDKTLVLELPLEPWVSFTKGCYLGQEVVARGTARGHANRRLVPLRLDGPEPPVGAALVRDGKEVGHVTTVGRAFGAGTLAALGFVRREHWEPGTVLGVRHGHVVTMATVTDPPLA